MSTHLLLDLARLLARVTPSPAGPPAFDPSPMVGYGVVGSIAVFGMGFMLWRLVQAETERKAAQKAIETQQQQHQKAIETLQQQQLKQAEAHKAELLEVYRSVMPALESATRAIQAADADRREHDIEREVARRTVGRP